MAPQVAGRLPALGLVRRAVGSCPPPDLAHLAAAVIISSWKIETDWTGTRRWFWVRVHDSLPALRRSAARYSRHNGVPEGLAHFGETIACVQRVAAAYLAEDTEFQNPIWPDDGLAGVVRLEQENLYTSVIYHEVVHAAATVYRMDRRPVINLGDGMADRDGKPCDLAEEEAFAYIYGELAADMDSGLRELVR